MTVETRFMFTAGLKRTIKVPRGTLSRIDRHVEKLKSTFGLGEDMREWSREITSRIATPATAKDYKGRVWNGMDDAGKARLARRELDELYCGFAREHEQFVDYVWGVIGKRKGEKTETLTPKRFAGFIEALQVSITIPTHRWTADYYAERMEHAYRVMRGGNMAGETFSDVEPLTPRQAAGVIVLFSQWLDEHDIRLDVPVDHDFLARSDDGGYDWCEKCGAIASDETIVRGLACEHGKECCLRKEYPEEFEDAEDADDD